jgi:hypothetical protein
MEVDSDIDNIDAENYKGIYEGDQKEKFICPKTGAHFEYFDLCKRMSRLRETRKQIDQQLGIVKDQSPIRNKPHRVANELLAPPRQ